MKTFSTTTLIAQLTTRSSFGSHMIKSCSPDYIILAMPIILKLWDRPHRICHRGCTASRSSCV